MYVLIACVIWIDFAFKCIYIICNLKLYSALVIVEMRLINPCIIIIIIIKRGWQRRVLLNVNISVNVT